MMGYGWGNGFGMMGGVGGFIMMMLFGILLIGLIFLLIFRGNNSCGTGHHTSVQNNNALEILKSRYAKGEIDTEEFNQRKKELE